MQIEDSTVWSAALATIGAIGTGAKMVVSRIGKLEANSISREEFEKLEHETVRREEFRDHVERSETSRKELRDGQIAIFNKIDEMKTTIIEALAKR